jgi:tripartite-type tricarboxylate transporter receptor subunit TctC
MNFDRERIKGEVMKLLRRRQFLAAGAVAFWPLSRRAWALNYPTRPVRFISGFLAGGPVDIATRVMADWFSSDLGQQFVVEDRGGMGGNLGPQAMINSSPDGYTLLLAWGLTTRSAPRSIRNSRLILFATPLRSPASCV